jgi:hypothetical protein
MYERKSVSQRAATALEQTEGQHQRPKGKKRTAKTPSRTLSYAQLNRPI